MSNSKRVIYLIVDPDGNQIMGVAYTRAYARLQKFKNEKIIRLVVNLKNGKVVR